jgi:hypothetical protein
MKNMNTKNNQIQLVTTVRTAGVWYRLMAISGILGFGQCRCHNG